MSYSSRFPKHVAIVMDGNGRWAKEQGLSRRLGHEAGTQVIQKIIDYAIGVSLEVLTLFAFSIENGSRPALEVNFLMLLLEQTLKQNIEKLHERNIKLRVIGNLSVLPIGLIEEIDLAQKLTVNNTGLILVIALNYSGQWDIVQGIHQMNRDIQNGVLSSKDVTPLVFQRYLCLSDLPDPDLLIRTGGEQRLSNFMLWQFAYTELFFTQVYWPDFSTVIFENALNYYCTRQRRFGLTPEQVNE